MARNDAGGRGGLVRCEACGEEYSATYRRCPFCGGTGQDASQEDPFVFEGGSVFDELDREREQARGEAPEQSRDTGRDTGRVPSSRGGKRLAADPSGGSPSRSGGGGSRSRSGGSRSSGKGSGSRGGSSQRSGSSGSRGAASGSRSSGSGRSAGGSPRAAGESSGSRDVPPTRGGGSNRSSGGGPRDTGESSSSRDVPPPRGGGSGGPPPARRRRGSSARRRQSAIREFWDRSGLTPTRIIGFFITLAVIIAIFLLITRLILPMIDRGGSVDTPDNSKDPGQSQTGGPSPSGSNTPSPSPSGSGTPDDSPEPTGDQIPAGQTATGFTLNRSEFAFSDQWPNPVTLEVTFIPAGSTGTVSWSSSDESIVTVDENGTVSPVGRGTAIITATLPGGVTQTCKVYNNMTTGAAPAPSPSADPDDSPAPSGGSGSLTLSREDFTLNDTWPSYTFTVTGASGAVTWRSSNTAVATVDANGKVTKVGSGTCTITATDAAGNTATCIVRCS